MVGSEGIDEDRLQNRDQRKLVPRDGVNSGAVRVEELVTDESQERKRDGTPQMECPRRRSEIRLPPKTSSFNCDIRV